MKTIAAIVAACLMLPSATLCAEEDADVGAKPVTVIVVDVNGAPVPKALIGNLLRNMSAISGKDEFKFERAVRSRAPLAPGLPNYVPTTTLEPATADDQGRAELTVDEVFLRGMRGDLAVVAMTPDRKQMGVMLAPPDGSVPEIRIVVQPVVVRTIHCHLPDSAGGKKESVSLYVRVSKGLPILVHYAASTSFKVSLPPGKYNLQVSSATTEPAMQEIEFGIDDDDIDITLNPKLFLALVGKPAPELAEIKDWLGGEPVTLEELKGKVVLLDFFGHWCGPCIAGMPHLFDLHDECHEKGLVIIGVHDDTVKDADELSELLAPHPKGVWKGRTSPFAIAIDGGGDQKIDGRDYVIQGKTTATYGISGWPTYVLIDRKGIVRGNYRPTETASRELLQSLLDEKP